MKKVQQTIVRVLYQWVHNNNNINYYAKYCGPGFMSYSIIMYAEDRFSSVDVTGCECENVHRTYQEKVQASSQCGYGCS